MFLVILSANCWIFSKSNDYVYKQIKLFSYNPFQSVHLDIPVISFKPQNLSTLTKDLLLLHNYVMFIAADRERLIDLAIKNSQVINLFRLELSAQGVIIENDKDLIKYGKRRRNLSILKWVAISFGSLVFGATVGVIFTFVKFNLFTISSGMSGLRLKF